MNKLTKHQLLEKTVEITKEYARGGGSSLAPILSSVYEELKKLNQDLELEER